MVFGVGLFNGVIKIYPGLPMLHWQRNFRQNRLQLDLYKTYRRDSCAYQGVFGVGILNGVRQILPHPTPVATATKFETNSVSAGDIS